VICEVLIAVTVTTTVIWDVTSCSLADMCRPSGHLWRQQVPLKCQ